MTHFKVFQVLPSFNNIIICPILLFVFTKNNHDQRDRIFKNMA